MATKLQVLERYFGYASFRPGQEELIDALLRGQDALGILPTGAGKSLCYQVPALLMEGVTLVVSPLISLMKDQVGALVRKGVRGAYLNSSLTWGQYQKALTNARAGVYKVIYVAPERLSSPEFLDFAANAPIAMVVVDEAHCVSQWGQDFRPGYLDVPDFVEKLPRRPVVSAFTATATPRVRRDILSLLRLSHPWVTVTSFDRPNLYFEVLRPRDKLEELLSLLQVRREEGAAPKKKAPQDLPKGDPQLYDRLRQVRAKLSAAQNVPVYVIFSNATLDAMAAYRPTTPAQLLEVPGVGQAKLQKYGMAFLKEIQDWARERAEQSEA